MGGEAGGENGAEHEVIWSDDFENGLDEWSVEGGTWAIGAPANSNEPLPLSGDNYVGTVIGGRYGTSRSARLISPEFVIPAAGDAPRFRFAYWYRFAESDYGQVQVRTPGGSWQDVVGGHIENWSGGWAQRIVDLRPFAGETVQIGLWFVSDDANTTDWGWYVDDAALERGPMGLAAPETFEGGFGDWSVEGGCWGRGSPYNANEPVPLSGTNHVGTAVGEHYGSGHDARLISPEFVVPAASQSPRFKFSYWYTFGTGDHGEVQYRVVGEDWESVAGGLLEQSNYSWSQQLVDLRGLAGRTIQIGLRFVSDDENTNDWGWYVDDPGLETGSMESGINDFEDSMGDWSVEGGVWALGQPSNANEPVPASGSRYMATVIDSHYGSGRDARLISPEYTVPSADRSPRFRFSYWNRMASGDYGQIQIRSLGEDWEDVEGGRIDQVNGSWSQQIVDLRSYAGGTVQIGLRFVSDTENTNDWGWYVDDAGFEEVN